MIVRPRTKRVSSNGYTLIEVVVAMGSATVLLAGLGSAVAVTAKAFRPESMSSYGKTSTAAVEQDLISDLRLATGFSERTDKAVTFTVPDRDADGRPEILRYAWTGQSGDPLTLSLNGGLAIPIATDVRSFSLSYYSQWVEGVSLPAEQDGSKVLLLVNDSKSLAVAEAERKSLLESWNFVVVVKGLNDGEQAIINEAKSVAAVYLSSSLNSTSAATIVVQLAAQTVGVVNEHPNFVDELGFASSTDTNAFTSSLNITNTSHHITSTSNSGSQSMGLFLTQYWLDGTLATNLNALGTVGGKPGLATIDPQDLLHDGRLAAGRRVVLPWGVTTADPALWNSACQELTCRAIEWASGVGNETPNLKIFGYNTVFTSQNGTSNIQYSTLATLPEEGTLKSITAYVGGANDQVRFAIYKDKSGQPEKLIVQSAIGNSTTSMAWVTLTVPDTKLSAGKYWLAFSFKNTSQRYRYNSTGSGERNKSNAAVSNGFLSTWGSSSSSFSGSRSIYATYEVPK
jgi:hypothetical protein